MRWRHPHRSVPFAALAVAAALVPGALVAQDGTPAAEERVPPPEACEVAPRPADEVAALLGLDGAPPAAVAAAAPAEIPIPLGRPAGNEVADALERTARELLACQNAGDPLRTTALFTDRAVLPVFGPAPTDPALVEQTRAELEAAPTPVPEAERRRFVTLSDASTLEDGRAAALLVFNAPGIRPGGSEAFLLFFERDGDRWLIDGLLDFTAVPTRPAGTPEATPSA